MPKSEMVETISFAGDEHIGVYTRVFEDVAFVPLDATELAGEFFDHS